MLGLANSSAIHNSRCIAIQKAMDEDELPKRDAAIRS